MKISIVVPTYNRAKFIGRTIKSVLSQSINDWELIIIDDGSIDNTEEVVFKFKKNDSRIIYIKLPNNKGVNFARNRGIEKATGEWINFIDSDDEYLKEMFHVIFSTLTNVDDNIDVVGFMILEDKDGETEKGGYRVDDLRWNKFYPTYEDVILKKGGKGNTNFCVRKKIFDEKYYFPEWINGFESLFFGKLRKNNKKFVYINKTVVLVHNDSPERLSQNAFLKQPLQFVLGYKKFVKEHNLIFQKHPSVLFKYYIKIARCYLKLKNPLAIWWILKASLIDFRAITKLIINKFKI